MAIKQISFKDSSENQILILAKYVTGVIFENEHRAVSTLANMGFCGIEIDDSEDPNSEFVDHLEPVWAPGKRPKNMKNFGVDSLL